MTTARAIPAAFDDFTGWERALTRSSSLQYTKAAGVCKVRRGKPLHLCFFRCRIHNGRKGSEGGCALATRIIPQFLRHIEVVQ